MVRATSKAAAAAVLAGGLLMGLEGYSPGPYLDSAGVLTDCFGNTKQVDRKHPRTKAQCIAKLDGEALRIAQRIDADTPDLPPNALIASISFAYNIGDGGYMGSTTRREFKAGRVTAGCAAMSLWDKITIAGVKVQLPGLVKRRAKEVAVCLQP